MKNPERYIVYLSFGSNMGDRVGHCKNALASLNRTDHTAVLQTSPLYQTEPVDYMDQDWFINGVAKVETELPPAALLQVLKQIERQAGRRKNPIRFGPRVLDLDIVLADSMVMDDPELTIPHPRMHKRCFVLKPLCDIDPNIVHPVLKRSMADLLGEIDPEGQEVKPYACSN